MAEPKKRKIASECRKFQTQWQNEYFFMEVKGKCVCLICNESVAVMKEYNLRRHDKTKHQTFTSYTVNIKHQLSDKACAVDFFSTACDESTDATDNAQLLIFLWGVDNNFFIMEDLLDLSSLKTTTMGKDMFEAVSDAIDKMGLKWDKLCGVTTDGAPAMTGERKGMASMVCAKMRESGGEAVKMHCIIHQEALCAKTIQLGDVLNTVVKTVNIIRARGLYHREFQTFLSDVDAEYGDLLYHSEVLWLSRGSMLRRFYSLRSEIDQFLKEKDRPLHQLSDPLWLADLVFLVDLTDHLNTLKKSLQGKDQLVPQLHANMKAFCVKLRLFETQLCTFNVAHFPTLSEIKSDFPKDDLSDKKGKYVSVITSLMTEFSQRFQDFSVIEKEIKLFAIPFLINAEEVEKSLQLRSSFPKRNKCQIKKRVYYAILLCTEPIHCSIYISNVLNAISAEPIFGVRGQSAMNICSLWEYSLGCQNSRVQSGSSEQQPVRGSIFQQHKFPLMRCHAKRLMSLFGSTYICEQIFSLMTLNKSRLRTKMTDDHLCDVLRISTTKLTPDLPAILQAKAQLHCSH
ncbi:General transcription factor II-I repeat domain-containing protein 2 [Merluccius polli]|uniref:General transcription factor II-I repeat domain-containing protein 2 n=1 Tax=Merluccius polli TaxID=89951 RepID=A0AA47NX25_MERPO|nr:General transcription factor II-I repeat domain-containing protein 2 [Merluccius polli]